MVFSSAWFLFGFFPVFFGIYFLVPHRWKNLWALVGSTFFYAWGGPAFVFVLFASLTADYFISLQFSKSTEKRRKWLLTLGLIINVGLLVYFKYANFFVDNFSLLLEALGMSGLHWTKVALPIGISFFTFQKISYLVDVYRGEKAPLKRWTDYALFVVLFPQLIAGPIVRFKEIADQIVDRRKWLISEERLLGLFRFSIGLGKKILIANPMGAVADGILNGTIDPNGGQAWLAMICYTFQIYFDFSGYSDMAIGLGRMMGFHFPENFNFPYLSKNITEFWRRWHITLSSWMRDYLYIPLGGNRKGVRRTYINLWLVFLISGLWHGDSWNFVIWGAYHGLWLVLERAYLLKKLSRLPGFVQVVLTFLIVMVGWLIFRIEDMTQLGHYLEGLLHFTPKGFKLDTSDVIVLILAVAFSFWNFSPRAQKWEQTIYKTLSPKKAFYLSLIAFSLILISSIGVASSEFNPFIYFRF